MNNLIKIGLLVLTVFFFSACGNYTPEEIEKIIANSKTLPQIDRLCSDIPKPKDFKFVGKAIGGNSAKSTIGHQFQSRMRYEDVSKFFKEWFESNGWLFGGERVETDMWTLGYLQFYKGNISVVIEHVAFPNAEYEIDCSSRP